MEADGRSHGVGRRRYRDTIGTRRYVLLAATVIVLISVR